MRRSSILLALAVAGTGCGEDGPSDAESAEGEATSETAGETGSDTGGETGDAGNPGAAPPTPVLLSPPDQSFGQALMTTLCWEPVVDPDGDDVRYRVFVDGVELVDGKLGDDGTSETCTPPLSLLNDREYEWTVSAFDADAPESASDPAAPWTFTTVWDGESRVILMDGLEDPNGWAPSGDASTGAWEWGNPVGTFYGGLVSQASDCVSGMCWFTGQNPSSDPWDADVTGLTILESPRFDLRGADSVTVGYQRHVRKSALAQTGVRFAVELVVPDASAPDGERSYVLEQLETEAEVTDQNLWRPVTVAGCGVPMVEDAYLRFIAEDLGTGVLEAAVDDLLVTGWIGTDVCVSGPGGVCNPDAPELSCGTDLLCCAQGVVNKGLFRCVEPAAGLDRDNPPANPPAMNPPGPGELGGPMGCPLPDVQPSPTLEGVVIDDTFLSQSSCAWLEGCIDQPGARRLLRFDATIENVGAMDLVMGIPSNHPDLFEFSPCHDHYHLEGFAEYQLLDGGGQVAARGHKQAFCLVDWDSWAWPKLEGWNEGMGDVTYTCQSQGVAVGWHDTYSSVLDCQWIDISDVAPGDYTLRVEVNVPSVQDGPRILNERDFANNVQEYAVTIP